MADEYPFIIVDKKAFEKFLDEAGVSIVNDESIKVLDVEIGRRLTARNRYTNEDIGELNYKAARRSI